MLFFLISMLRKNNHCRSISNCKMASRGDWPNTAQPSCLGQQQPCPVHRETNYPPTACLRTKLLQSCLDSFTTPWTVAHQSPLFSQARILEWVAMPSSRGSSRPRDWIQVSHITGRFLLSEPPGKPMNTAVGSLSLLQGIFLNQESNWVLLHCRWILYPKLLGKPVYVLKPLNCILWVGNVYGMWITLSEVVLKTTKSCPHKERKDINAFR